MSADDSQRVLAVFNFEPEGASIEVDAAAINASHFTDLSSRQAVAMASGKLTVKLPPFGYELLLVH